MMSVRSLSKHSDFVRTAAREIESLVLADSTRLLTEHHVPSLISS